jgi:hypothetical protein
MLPSFQPHMPPASRLFFYSPLDSSWGFSHFICRACDTPSLRAFDNSAADSSEFLHR